MMEKLYTQLASKAQVVFVVFILVSCCLVFYPPLQNYTSAKIAVDVMAFGLLALNLARGMKDKTLKMTIPQIYGEAKKGRKFAPLTIELACIVAVNIAFWKTI